MNALTDELRGWKEVPGMSDDAIRKLFLMDEAADRLERYQTALKSMLIGGNHLANVLIGRLGPGFAKEFPPTREPDEALRLMGAGDDYEVWCCWRAIMLARNGLPEHERPR